MAHRHGPARACSRCRRSCGSRKAACPRNPTRRRLELHRGGRARLGRVAIRGALRRRRLLGDGRVHEARPANLRTRARRAGRLRSGGSLRRRRRQRRARRRAACRDDAGPLGSRRGRSTLG